MTVNNLSFQTMQFDDIETVATLEKQFFSTPWSKASLENAIKNSAETFWVAKLEGDVVGYLGFMQSFECADILTVCIDPTYRRKGYAESLLCFCLEQMKINGVEKVFLEVRESNLAARTLYEKVGFTYFNKRVNYYKDPTEDAFVMIKEMK